LCQTRDGRHDAVHISDEVKAVFAVQNYGFRVPGCQNWFRLPSRLDNVSSFCALNLEDGRPLAAIAREAKHDFRPLRESLESRRRISSFGLSGDLKILALSLSIILKNGGEEDGET
jgi:hypothetical protein